MNEPTFSPEPPQPDQPVEPPHQPWNVAEDYPVLTVLGAFLVGVALGCAVPHEPPPRKRFYEEPLDDVKDLLHRLIGSVQKQTASVVDTAEARASGVIDSVKSVLKRCH